MAARDELDEPREAPKGEISHEAYRRVNRLDFDEALAREAETLALEHEAFKAQVLAIASGEDNVNALGLTPQQLTICRETGCSPRVFASLLAQRRAAR